LKRVHLRYAIYGLFFGFILSRIGFSSFGEVHRMFTFADLRLLLTFASGVAISALGFWFVGQGDFRTPKPIHKGTIAGSALFGIGWAITGACPAIVLVQLGEGQLPALATLAGLALGTGLYPRIHARFFRWAPSSCDV